MIIEALVIGGVALFTAALGSQVQARTLLEKLEKL